MIIDAVEYFKQLRAALLTARHSVMIVGWDFDTRIELDRDDAGDGTIPNQVGALIDKAVADNPELQVYVLRWDLQFVKTPLRGATPLVVLDWVTGDRTHFKLDAHHPISACHHQKLVVIDDALAFCGGIDITDGRWDTPEHLDDEPRRQGPAGNDNPPWHDATVALHGPVAQALGDLARSRWQLATGEMPAAPPPGLDRWPATLEPDFCDVDVGIARTSPEYEGAPLVAEIAALYLAAIASARNNIYLESQYFSAPVVAEAIAARLREADGPDVVIVNPRTADGWLEAKFMDSARAVLLARLRAADVHGRLRFCTPVTAGGDDIYVHAKVLVIDDRLLRVGSSNINKRSLDTDTECDVAIEASGDNADVCANIARIRNALLVEHLGISVADWEAALTAADGRLVAALDSKLRPSGRTLAPFEPEPLSAVELALAETQVNDVGPEAFAASLVAQLAKPLRRFVPWAALAAGLAAAAFVRVRRT
ncbi:phospholipase D/transphosphatidylase [Polymorphobacter glacialis]|uniref:Phospholipase D n=1 Tax=Sandarakinorhabdus glacialis TaxID=1614636 RepID=A0A916ZXV2_9SPHN|nr:phospholipase D/transphosphatidylase [Polymorphobacter glacialis]